MANLTITKLQIIKEKDRIKHKFIFSDNRSFDIESKNDIDISKAPGKAFRTRYDIPAKHLVMIRAYYKKQPEKLADLPESEPVDSKLVGISGWLIVFLLAMGVSVILGTYGFINLSISAADSSEIDSFMIYLFISTGAITALAIATIILTLMKQKVGRYIGIAFCVLSIVDSIAFILITGERVNVFGSLLWLLYLLLSKRVRYTLTK